MTSLLKLLDTKSKKILNLFLSTNLPLLKKNNPLLDKLLFSFKNISQLLLNLPTLLFLAKTMKLFQTSFKNKKFLTRDKKNSLIKIIRSTHKYLNKISKMINITSFIISLNKFALIKLKNYFSP
jgi:hypothetical protein